MSGDSENHSDMNDTDRSRSRVSYGPRGQGPLLRPLSSLWDLVKLQI